MKLPEPKEPPSVLARILDYAFVILAIGGLVAVYAIYMLSGR